MSDYGLDKILIDITVWAVKNTGLLEPKLSLRFHIFCFKKKATNRSLFSHSLYIQHTPLNSPGIYIRTLIPDGPAAADGRLCIGDRILAVNGTSLIGADYQRSVLG